MWLMNFAAGSVALLLTAPVAVLAAMLWWPLTLGVLAVAALGWVAERRAAL